MRNLAIAFSLFLSLFTWNTATADTTIPHGTQLTGNVTWTKAASPYIVLGMGVASDATLTIEPGTIIKFIGGGGIGLNGNVTVGAPAPAEPVIFTSLKDDSVGGDTNGDGSASLPVSADWNGIFVVSGTTTMTNTIMRYGGSTGNMLVNQGGDLALMQSELAYVPSDAFRQYFGTTTIHDTAIHDTQTGLNIIGGQLTLATTTFYHTGSNSAVISGSSVFINQGGNSGARGFFIQGTITRSTTWVPDGLPYIFYSGGTGQGADLTILPGTIVKFEQGGGMGISGNVTIGAPSPAEPVIFTSLRDDTVAGDTNGDGTATLPFSGIWNGIFVVSGSTTITNTVMRYGGSTGNTLVNQGGDLSLMQSELSYVPGDAFRQLAGTTTISDTSIHDTAIGINLIAGQLMLATTTFHHIGSNAVQWDGSARFINRGGNSGERGYLLQGIITQSTTWIPDGLPYIVYAGGTSLDATLTILPGAIVKFMEGGGIGTAHLTIGSDASTTPVIFTSIKDDSVLGDTNGDGTVTAPASADWNGLYVQGTGTIKNAVFRYGGSFQGTLNNSGTLSVSHTTINNSGAKNFAQTGGTTTMTDVELHHAEYGAYLTGGSLTIHDSSIHDHTQYGVFNITTNIIDATNNWWGSATGPRHPTNPLGIGDLISNNVNYGEWLTEEPATSTNPAPCLAHCYSNVLFLPGIMGSRLYDSTGNVRWLPEDDVEADYVRMNSDGTSALPDITTKDALDTADFQQGYTDIYKSFLAEMKTWEEDYHITATTTPYDWRLDYNTVVTKGRKLPNGRISYLVSPEAGHDPYILETLKQLAATSKTGKVTIIGHSQGGLIAKALMQQIGATETAALIDNIILVATPQLGTPKAVGGLLNGFKMGIIGAVSDEKVRDLGQHTPSAFSLLPSANYFTYVDDPVVTISSSTLSTWSTAYGDIIHDQQNMFNFMSDASHLRAKPAYADLKNPEIVSTTFLENARTTHNSLDAWTPPEGLQLTTIAGWGMETLSGIEYKTTPDCVRTGEVIIQGTRNVYCAEYQPKLTLEPKHVIDGDGTVVEPSALWANGANSTRYWVNLDEYNFFNPAETGFGVFSLAHANIFEVPQLRNLLENILVETIAPHDYISTTAPASTGNAERLHFILHSPLTLGFTDTLGNYTGSTATSTVFNIPDVHYERYGEVQWLSIPKELAGQLVLHGTGSGSFTLDAEEVSGNDTLSLTSFEGVPSSTSTIVTMDITPAVSPTASSTLVVDYDGDSITDFTLESQENGTATLPPPDLIAPTTVATPTGTLGTNNWYTSNVLVTLTATDTESGIASTSYSLNGGAWLSYTTPFTITTEGTTTLRYYSTDTAGNIEATSTFTIKIDKTAPRSTNIGEYVHPRPARPRNRQSRDNNCCQERNWHLHPHRSSRSHHQTLLHEYLQWKPSHLCKAHEYTV